MKVHRPSIRRTMSLVPILGFVMIALACTEVTVDTLVDGGPGSLRQAIDDAGIGDEILIVVVGTMTLTGGPLIVDDPITIVGPGTNNLTISGDGASRVFVVSENGSVTMSQLTISGGFDPVGGAGIKNEGRLTLNSVSVVDNHGGGISNGADTPGAVLELNDSTVGSNTGVGSAAAGISNWRSGTVMINGSTIVGNTNTSDCGGGIWNAGPSGTDPAGTLILSNSTVRGNQADTGAGVCNAGFATLTNVTVSSNVGGGIVNNNPGEMTLLNGTVTLNTGIGVWGTRSVDGDAITNLKNTIVAGNAGTGPDCSFPPSFVSQGSNLIGNSDKCDFSESDGDIVGTGASPIDPMLGPLQYEGGTTQTHRLLPGGPAIDAGDNIECPTVDQRGVSRPQGPGCDNRLVRAIIPSSFGGVRRPGR